MRIAIFSDAHGNYLNLLSFFKSTEELGIQQFICLGDLCNYYPDNKKVIDFIKVKNMTCLLGNHDDLYISKVSLSGQKKQDYNFDEALLLDEDRLKFLKSLPLSYEIEVSGKKLFFCHASPHDLINTYVYPDSDLDTYNEVPYDYIFMGHTHRQFLKEHNGKLFCNVGSIGLPRDNGTMMGFAVLETQDMSVTLYRKKINVEEIKTQYQNNTPIQVLELLNRKETINYNYTII